MNHHGFDQTSNGGWRKFGSANNYQAAINSIIKFVKKNGWGNEKNGSHALRWHLFQLYAMAGKMVEAKKVIESVIQKDIWNDYYTRGTLAWLNKDKEALQKEIDAAKADTYYVENVGTNIEIMERLLNGIGKPYKEVY
jgi:hypothetical protein